MNIIGNKYLIEYKIGEGTFGTIYKGTNIRTKEQVAIKVEQINNRTKLIKNESNIYQYLKDCKFVPNIKWFGKDTNNYYMVINLLGDSLNVVKEKQQQSVLTLKQTLQIGVQIIIILEQIHNKGLVHRDIKPDNFLFGLNNNVNKLFIIDFGLCKTYLNGDNKHIQIKSTSSLIGTPTFASINSHNCLELSRRDDLESLGYMLIYFVNINLSWQCIIENNQIMEHKQNITRYDYVPSIIIKYMDYIKSLTFDEAPNYSYLTNMLSSEI